MSAVCAACSGSTWHRDGCRFEDTISDGFGSEWAKCRRPDCGLHVVRPGKARCDCEEDASDNPAEDAQEAPGAPQGPVGSLSAPNPQIALHRPEQENP